jgi:hypothetical protein
VTSRPVVFAARVSGLAFGLAPLLACLRPPWPGATAVHCCADCRHRPVNRCFTREGRCRSVRNGGSPPAHGSRDGRQASARRARRAPARQGAAFADAPSAGRPPSFTAEAFTLVVGVPPFSRARTTGFRHSRRHGAADLIRGGGP